jgi:SAM-dependent methyltransferase
LIPGGQPSLYLDSGNPAWSRLQAQIWDPEVEAWLSQIDVQPGWQCVDLGCGAMGILEPLSRRSGASGRVIGIEPRPSMLTAAGELVRRSRLDNVRLLDIAPNKTSLPDESFQLVHERFLLSAGWNERELLGEMIRLARRGGIVALQEPDLSSWHSHPDHDAWARLREAVRAAFAAGGGDLDAGCRTFGLAREAGLDDVRIRAATIALQGAHPVKRLLVDLAESHREQIVQGGILDERDLEEVLAECDAIARDPSTVVVSFLISQVWGRKTGRPRPPKR